MMISEGKVVTLSYTLKSSKGELLDQASAMEPLHYLHGYSEIVPGLEKALEGKPQGFKSAVEIAPEEAYGPELPDLRTTVERKAFPEGTELNVGMRFKAEVENQPIVFTVAKVEGDNIHIDGNHPLAGQTLHFDVEVIGIREATSTELEHGHAHGPDGSHPHH